MLFLAGTLLAGTAVAWIDRRDDRLDGFHVMPQAVPVPAAVAPVDAGPVAINRADAERLESLPGIGPKTAAAIVDARAVDGPFSSIDDLRRVRGIGAATVERLRPLVTVD